MRRIATLELPAGVCPIYCGSDVASVLRRLWRASWRSAAVIADSNTALFGQPIAALLAELCDCVVELQFEAGEQRKTRATKAALEDQLLRAGLGRDCCIVAVGGGVVLDVAGFVAATYMRGVPHLHVATSLVAQVDAAIGGKTGVNTAAGKNMIGAFHQPMAVLIDADALTSLPRREMRSGFAEAVKYAVIADADLFDALERWAATDGMHAAPLPPALVARCVRIKVDVVAEDEREQGRRQVLNFGHTVAHAIEAASDHTVSHGAAVAAGMVVEARLAEQLKGFGTDETQRLIALLRRLELPVVPQADIARAAPFFKRDKKACAGAVRCALPSRIGVIDPPWVQSVDLSQIYAAWQRCR